MSSATQLNVQCHQTQIAMRVGAVQGKWSQEMYFECRIMLCDGKYHKAQFNATKHNEMQCNKNWSEAM